MAGLKKIKTRIGSVKSTQQMTKAMKMVSAARLRAAQNRILNLRAYAKALEEVLGDVVLSQRVSHPFLEQKKKKDLKSVLWVVMTSDRGLCGGFNGNICRFTEQLLKEESYSSQDFFFIGRKGEEYFRFRGIKGQGTLLNLVKEISYPMAAKIARELMEEIQTGKHEGVFVIYNEFKTIISPRIVYERLLPFDLKPDTSAPEPESRDILFEVPPEEIIENLLDRYFSIQLYRYMCENVAAEHGSRMAAMESATNNAEELISKLTLKYNKMRQSAITTELTEIIGGVEALN